MKKQVLLAKMLMILTFTGFLTAFSSQSYAQCDLIFEISSPSWGDGTTWTVTDASNTVVLSGGPYGNGYSDTQTIPAAGNGPYALNLTSTLSDNSPNYNVSSGATVLFSGTAPASQTTNVGPINCPAPPSCEIAVTMSSASWGDGTTWTLTDADNNVVLSGGPYGNGYSDTQVVPVADNGPYSLNITSTLGDNSPSYSVSVDGNVLYSGTAPASQTTNITGITCSGPPSCDVVVTVSSASWGDGTTWTLTDTDGNTVLSGGPYGNGYSDTQSISAAANGPYTLTIVSTLSDNSPNYNVTVSGATVFSGTAPAAQTTVLAPIAPECFTPPTPCGGALPISCNGTASGTTIGAPTDAVDFCGTANGTGGKVWYTFTGTGETLTASTCGGASWDTKLWVFSGDCNALTCVGGNDDACGVQSTVIFPTTNGVTYYIVVGGFGASEGAYTLNLTGCAPPPAGCDLTFEISSASWGDCTNWTVTDNDGNVVLSGGPYGNGYADVQTLSGANNGPYNWNIVSFCFDNSPNYTVSSGADVLFTGNVPGNSTANVGPINCPVPPGCDITVNMSSASWGDGTTWTLTDASNNVVLSGGPYGNGYADSQTLSGASNDPYTLNIITTFGDNSPNYEVLVDGNLEWSGNIPGGQTGTVSNITCAGNVPPPPAGCDLTFEISSASWGDCTNWTVTDNDGNVVLSGGPYGNGYADVQTLSGANNGPYNWNIVSFCFDNSPNYTVSSGADVLFTGNVPGNSTANVGPINCPAPPSCEIAVTMSSASWGDGTTWTLTDASNNVVLSGGPYGNGYSDTQILAVADNGPYSLNITSTFGDNSPSYSVSVDGNVVFSGTAPASQTTNITGITCSAVPPCQIDVDMSSASWGDGTTWTLTDADGNTVLSGGPYGNGYSDSQSIPSAQDGPYTLTIVSTFGDNTPNYVVSVGGNVVFSGTAPAAQTTVLAPIAPECSIPPTPCEGALPIACGDVVTGSTVGAPTDAVPTCVTTNGTGGKIWYEFTGTGDVVTATTCSALTNYDTKLWVFSGDCDNLVCVTGNDDMGAACGFSGLQSNVEFVSTLGETYYIIVGGFGAGAGDYELTVTCTPVPSLPECTGPISVIENAPCSATSVQFVWDAVVDADGYNIYAGDIASGNYNLTPTPVFTALPEIFLNDAPANTTFYLLVVPTNLAGEAVGCVEISYTTPEACPPPANDDICDAFDLTSGGAQDINTFSFLSDMTCFNQTGTTSSASGTFSASCGALNNPVWYTFTTPMCDVGGVVPFQLEFTTANAGNLLDSRIAVFSADGDDCSGALTEVACNGDGFPPVEYCGTSTQFFTSHLFATLEPGKQYWVAVANWSAFDAGTTFVISGRAIPEAHGVTTTGGGTQIQLSTNNMGAALYTYYYKLVGSTGHSTSNSQSALTNVRTLAPGNDYITQIMYRCDANFFNQNQWYRTEPQTITLENTCALVNDMTCMFNGDGTYTMTWTEPTGDLFTNNGALSGYRIKRNPVGSTGVYTFSNPAVVCDGGTCSVTLPGNSPTGFNWTIETRCSANNIQVGNTTSCGPAPEMTLDNDGNNNIDRSAGDVFSFVNVEAGIEFVDVQMFDAYADFGLNTPMIGDYEIFVNDNNEINWRRVDAPAMSFDFIIVPNPTNAMSTVYLSTIVEEGSFTVIDAMGRTINAGSINNTDNIDLDATQLQSGVYMVVVTVGNQQLTRRLIVAN